MRSFDHKPYDYSDRVMRAKELIDAGHEVSDSLVPRYLVESWQRSHDLGVRIADHLEPPCFTQRILSDEDRVLSSIVGDEIDAIWNSFGGEHWAVYCTSPEGLITRARHGTNPHSEAYALHVGRRIQERDVGTTAPACAYHAKRPIMLSGNEHFLNEFSHHFCCAVPIWGAWGEIVGVLNVTGSEEFKSKLVQTMLTTASIKIQNRIFLQTHRDARIFKFHFDAEFLDTHHAGLIATTSKGDVISATYNALEMLDPIDPITTPMAATDIFQNLSPLNSPTITSIASGINFYLNECTPTSILVPQVSARREIQIKDVSRAHALDVIQSVDGNMAKAARILGISRTTLYRLQKKEQPAQS